jgi:nucleoside-diphosphate kinase
MPGKSSAASAPAPTLDSGLRSAVDSDLRRVAASRRAPRAPARPTPSEPALRLPHLEGTVTERTLVLVKPDGVQRLLVGRIIARFEERGLKLVGLKLVRVSRELAEAHYAVHREKPFFRGLVDFITSGPLVAAVLEGPGAIGLVRTMVGATRPSEAVPGSIRGDLAIETGQNLVHASDGPETAAAEIALWFRPDELVEYERAIDRWVIGPGD